MIGSKASVEEINNTALNTLHYSGVGTKNPLILEFYRALKNQKVFGAFCSRFKVTSLSHSTKVSVLLANNIIYASNISFKGIGQSEFVKRIKILSAMIYLRKDDEEVNTYSTISKEKILGYYAKEYFKNKEFLVKHSVIYYKLLYGFITLIIGLIMMLWLIFYFWGKAIFSFSLLLSIIYICIGLYKLSKNNVF